MAHQQLLNTRSTRVILVGDGTSTQGLSGLPNAADYPWAFTFKDVGLALSPWLLEQSFAQGHQTVLVLNVRPNETDVNARVNHWLSQLGASTQLLVDTDDGSVLARASDAAQTYIEHRKQQLIDRAKHALAQGEIVLGVPYWHPKAVGHAHEIATFWAVPRTHDAPQGAVDVLSIGTNANDWPKRLQAVQQFYTLFAQYLGCRPDPASVLQFSPLAGSWWGRLRLQRSLRQQRATTVLKAPYTAVEAQPWHINTPKPTAPPGLNVMGYVRAELGQGEACRSLVQACVAAQVPFSVTDLGFQTHHPQADYPLLAQAQNQHFAIDLHYVNAAQEAPTAQYLNEQGLGRNRYTIGFWHWEQPQIPVAHWSAFSYLDEVWAPSQFVAQAVADVSPLPVFTVPHAIVCEASTGAQRANFGLPEGRLLVLVMYDFLSFQQRKNPEAAVRAFRMASAQAPEMGLVIKTINGHQHPEALATLKSSVADLPHVFFVDDFLTRQQVWDLQACCDVLLSLHRAEGFGLAPAEMMRLGKAVVATGWSANMDFMTEHNSMPVRYTLKPLQHDVGPYPAGPLWAEADEEHAAWCLVQLAQHADWRQRLGQAASHSIRTQLSPQAVGQRIAQRLKTLGHWHPKLLAPAQVVSQSD